MKVFFFPPFNTMSFNAMFGNKLFSAIKWRFTIIKGYVQLQADNNVFCFCRIGAISLFCFLQKLFSCIMFLFLQNWYGFPVFVFVETVFPAYNVLFLQNTSGFFSKKKKKIYWDISDLISIETQNQNISVQAFSADIH